ncbi:3-galactosyl-N-acetylglucosaminide 4-alpha-L-fucosyltransferase FUT3-like [Bombina bombina]|uniref:3-galactosyl-N-acetylglucosaminide 4-alpha-L-fucosyltransferase FUT3-like n=1 Tax=Bombina bombina TaxID=8345 RepID=UPI00235AFBAF|nr:3-galactosyl-N-acetylglucosaminide 4-alpha-L-fucosyltransferase FUT3-like [Bombina bombina]XP_053576137.1 3-galactosyl-N-acetylglucosaminide 4-alpha-L-fucosyltransferase FUT3-like [Bombina bombina]XP_053576138.1 3-galactosyl-N-acetylglucosaminide 4-alpha-L-fucosyltransferase FUT3-like [Bombina bombina]XP_053576139.1 3-galactosyl-N-acetylglucosaminide 4-alpha-L-fucosyltransferase FUT3-like [Bombina bombina]XP_053576140.1 3-galactosyl-N-acetylglucosaminide 4-alpha-L-fucosyltransferase FUT3-lik
MGSFSLVKICFFAILQMAFLCFLFSTFSDFKIFNQERNQTLNSSSERESFLIQEKTYLILLWKWRFKNQFPYDQCPYDFDTSGCFYTGDRNLYSDADAVILHHDNVRSSRDLLPKKQRPTKQYWIWFCLESPTHSPNLTLMDNLINLTMSYRADSDIFTPYGWLGKHDSHENFTIPLKTKLVAWAVSNWNPNYRRSKYYLELKKYIQIDMYGRHRMLLPKDNYTMTFSTYKFYLAFENSIHDDYITEKLWNNSFHSGTVPVVMGPPRSNYERFVPPDSFIHVDDFQSPKELASYLLELDKDDKRYKQYFNWRSKFKPEGITNYLLQYCKVCKALKEAPAYRTIPSIDKWFK